MLGIYITYLREYSVFLAALDDFQLKHFLYLQWKSKLFNELLALYCYTVILYFFVNYISTSWVLSPFC